jgi:hypothetical protein
LILERFQTSCPCLRVEEPSILLGPGESAAFAVKFDPANDPGFRGKLSIEVVGLGVAGGVVFKTNVNVEVRAEPADQPAPGHTTAQDTGDLQAVGQGVAP